MVILYNYNNHNVFSNDQNEELEDEKGSVMAFFLENCSSFEILVFFVITHIKLVNEYELCNTV